MAKGFKVKIITPDNDTISLYVESLSTNTSNGVVEFRCNHAAIILSTVPATTILSVNGKKERVFTSSGIVHMENNELKFCCDSAEKVSNIDRERAKNAKLRAEKRLKDNGDIDIERAKLALARANARIETIGFNQ